MRIKNARKIIRNFVLCHRDWREISLTTFFRKTCSELNPLTLCVFVPTTYVCLYADFYGLAGTHVLFNLIWKSKLPLRNITNLCVFQVTLKMSVQNV